jgi:flagellar biosynthetic protein FliQ
MTQDTVVTIMREAVMCIITTSAPPLLLGLVVGLIVSIFQTVTSINEQTLVFVPKILAVFFGIVIFGTFMLSNLEDLFIMLYSDFTQYIR